MVAWNAGLSPSIPVCSDGLTVDRTPPVLEGVVIPGSRVEGGLVQDAGSGVFWLIGVDRERDVVRGGEAVPECSNRATIMEDLSLYPIRMAG